MSLERRQSQSQKGCSEQKELLVSHLEGPCFSWQSQLLLLAEHKRKLYICLDFFFQLVWKLKVSDQVIFKVPDEIQFYLISFLLPSSFYCPPLTRNGIAHCGSLALCQQILKTSCFASCTALDNLRP